MKEELDFSEFHTFCMGLLILSGMILFYGFSLWGIYESIQYPCWKNFAGAIVATIFSIIFLFKMRSVIEVVKATYPVKS